MFKSKHTLFVFKKIVFQFFYFSFISIIYYELINSKLKFQSISLKFFLVAEMLFVCYMLFLVNVLFLEKELFVKKKFVNVLFKNVVVISLILVLLPFFNCQFKFSVATDTNTFFGYHLLFLSFTLAASLYYLDFINYLQNK
jgi:hypothetical protein